MDTIDPEQKSERAAGAVLDAPMIQPVGFLLALSDEWMVERVSTNAGDLLGCDQAGLVGSLASAFITDDAIHSLRNRLALLRGPDAVERLFLCPLTQDGRQFDIAIHNVDDSVLVEAEPSTGKSYGDVTGTLRGMLGRLDDAADFKAFLTAGARQVRALTGFDRILITRFDRDGSREVVAECERGGIGSFLGTRISAELMPADERARFLRAPLHVIADVDSEPVPIVPRLDTGGEPLDLSRSMLRCASAARLEHLRSMGARASISVALLVDGDLWGMIECHHHTPRRPTFERRSMAELFAQMFAMRIEIAELKRGRGGEQRG
ncbi:MAG: GAF domain-containing protein [Pseudomonadota bacterium]|nr:GAF domain-containing protein [Pseudomonadota bacterium]